LRGRSQRGVGSRASTGTARGTGSPSWSAGTTSTSATTRRGSAARGSSPSQAAAAASASGSTAPGATASKEVQALDVARAAESLLHADARRIAGRSFNCYDRYVGEEQVARVAKELTGSATTASDLSRAPKHQIDTAKLRPLGMAFGGEALLRRTAQEPIDAHRAP
jgi:hypothetical protein